MISVPKKAVPKSVRRNRLKRLVREALRVSKVRPDEGVCWRFFVKKNPSESIGMVEVVSVIKRLVDQK